MAEIILITLGLVLILVPFVGSTALLLLLPTIKRLSLQKRFPTTVPRWRTRLSSPPPFLNSIDDVAEALQLFLDTAVREKKYSYDELKKNLNSLYIEWVPSEGDFPKRYITDTLGRSIAGDHNGDLLRIVYLKNDTLNNIAFFHELGHEALELEGEYDYEHTDDVIWKDIVGACKTNFKK